MLLFRFTYLRVASDDAGLDAALVGATEDAEGTLLTPGIVPGVCADPVGSAIINTPSDHLDSMSSKTLTSDVLVDTRSVGFKVFIYSHGNRDSSMFHDFSLDILNALDGVRIQGFNLVLGVRSSITRFVTSVGTLWGFVFI